MTSPALALRGSQPPRVRATRRWAGPVDPAVWALAAATIVVRVPFVTRHETPDEGGLLLLAGQWSPGRSLYSDYWVDRPPLLVGFFAVADRLGGPGRGGVIALHMLGLILVAVSVLLAGRLARAVLASGRDPLTGAPNIGPAVVAGVAAVLLCQPRFGAFQIDGELVAMPLLLGGFLLGLTAARADHHRSLAVARLVAAAACAVAAAWVKQNEIDACLFLLLAGPGVWRGCVLSRRGRLLALGSGAALVSLLVLAVSASRGTSVVGLWEAVVGFRWHASGVIASQASAATTSRLHQLLLGALLAGVPLLLVRWVLALRRPPSYGPSAGPSYGRLAGPSAGGLDLRLGASVVLAWELVSVLAGGSYWSHYLLCLIPGLVLGEAHLQARPVSGPAVRHTTRSASGRAPALAAITALCAWPLVATYAEVATAAEPDPTTVWLRDHARPGDTGLVAFGGANLLHGAGLTSPYRELWSLPVRVRDPHLTHLTRVLESPRRPTWIVTGPSGDLSGWGIDDRWAEVPFRSGYREVASVGGTRIFQASLSPVPRSGLSG